MPQTITSLDLHNQNCYYYLKNLGDIPDSIKSYLPEPLVLRLETAKMGAFDSKQAYADLYTEFFKVFEEINIPENQYKKVDIITAALKANANNKVVLEAIDTFILSIYANDNHILENTYKAIEPITQSQDPSKHALEHRILKSWRGKPLSSNRGISPLAENSLWRGAVTTFLSPEFKPQHTTSLATVRHYQYQTPEMPQELRFGTQGQRHDRKSRIGPLFKHWLEALARQHPGKNICHVYFNNLSRDRTDAIGAKEAGLTSVLHELEPSSDRSEGHPNIAVITLPADRAIMSRKEYAKTQKNLPYEKVFEEFLAIASETNQTKGIKDFHISPRIRTLLFSEATQQEQTLKDLLTRSFTRMGITPNTLLSPAQRQAVWFHFLKCELTNYILRTLNPVSVNFTCKDAIDRGGVSSAYYNLMKSLGSLPSTPMTREEFDQALHAAPAMVKGRGMNHHLVLIWNTIDAYLQKSDNPKTNWMAEWRDLNCPHARVKELLGRRITEVRSELLGMQDKQPDSRKQALISQSLLILQNIEKQEQLNLSGKRLLLEVVTRTSLLANDKNVAENTKRYEQLNRELSIKHPCLQVIICAMKIILASLVVIVSAGKIGQGWVKDGYISAKTGLFASTRRDMQEKMSQTLQQLRQSSESTPSPKQD